MTMKQVLQIMFCCLFIASTLLILFTTAKVAATFVLCLSIIGFGLLIFSDE